MENQSPDLKISHHTTPAPRLNLVPQSYSTPALLQNIQPSQLASMATAAAAKTSTTTAIMNGNAQNTTKPHLRIVEQPAQNNQRFRYMVEGRSAGSLKGVNSTPENSTYPTIEIANYNKKAVVIVSCVTADKPYRPHPHKMVGRDCKDGICQLTLNEPPLRASFNNLGIQCTKKKDMEQSLEERRRKKINPFNTPYTKDQKIDYDLHVVRLCFQPFIDPTGNGWEPLDAVVSDPIIDSKKQMGLSICQLCGCAARANGGDRKILLCEKVDKNDIKIKFTEFFAQGGIKWYAYADFNPQDVHKQTAIYFKTPSYERTDITEPVTVFIQLERPSDKAVSEPMEFQFTPDPGMRTFQRIRRKIKRKEELDIFQQILSLDSETTATKYSCPLESACNDENDETVSSDSSASKPNSSDTLNEYEAAIRRRMCDAGGTGGFVGELTDLTETDDVDDAQITRPLEEEMDIEFEVPQINYLNADESTQTSTPMDEILKQQQLLVFNDDDSMRALSAIDKITEWMHSSEFERTDSLTVENGDNLSLSPVTVVTNLTCTNLTNTTTDDDRNFSDLMEQVAELDDIINSRRGTLEQITETDDSSSRRNTLEQITEISGEISTSSRRATLEQFAELSQETLSRRSTLDNSTVKEFPLRGGVATTGNVVPSPLTATATASAQPSVELDETFDETATYTSLKHAFKNPIDIPNQPQAQVPQQRKLSQFTTNSTTSTEEELAGLVVLKNPPAPKIKVNIAETALSPPSSPPLPLPPCTPSPIPDQKLPPLPPKRRISQEPQTPNNVSNNSTPNSSLRRGDGSVGGMERNGSLPSPSSRPPSQIIIMRSPEQSPTKQERYQSASPTPTASPKKKQGFFARLFSRKSKPDMKSELASSEANSTSTPMPTPTALPPPTPPTPLEKYKNRNDSKSPTPSGSREPSIGHFSLTDPNRSSVRSAKSLQPHHSPGLSPHSSTNVSVRSMSGNPVGRSASSVSGKRPNHLNADVIHIPLKGDDTEPKSPTISTFGRQLDRRTLSALQLADIPVCEGGMELVAIADRQSIKNLCEGDFGIVLDPSVDLGEAEHFALYTTIVDPEQEAFEMGNGGEALTTDGEGHIVQAPLLTADEIAMRLAQANGLN